MVDSEDPDVFDISFAPDGTRFVTASGAPEIQVWDALSGGERTKSLYEQEYILTIAVSPSSLLIASGSKNSTVCLWNAVSGELVSGPWHRHEGIVSLVCFSPDERFIASSSFDKTVKLWNISDGDYTTFEGHTGDVYSVAFSSSKPYIASGLQR